MQSIIVKGKGTNNTNLYSMEISLVNYTW